MSAFSDDYSGYEASCDDDGYITQDDAFHLRQWRKERERAPVYAYSEILAHEDEEPEWGGIVLLAVFGALVVASFAHLLLFI